MKKIRNIFLVIFLILLSSIVLLSVTAVFIAARYEKEINGYFLSWLNSRLKTEVKISGMEFSLLKNFPFAGVTLNHVFVRSALQKNDTLLSAERLSFSFRVQDVFSKNFSVRKAEISDGMIKIIITEKNRKNYDIWMEDTARDGAVQFNLASLLMEDIRMVCEYKPGKWSLDGIMSKGLMTGVLAPASRDVEINIRGTMNRFTVEGTQYINGKNLIFETHFQGNDDHFRFNNGKVQTKDYRFDFSGTCDLSGSKTTTDIIVNFRKFDLANLKKNIPGKFLEPMKNYSCSGISDIKINIKGEVAEKTLPSVKITFKVHNGECIINRSAYTWLSAGPVPANASGYPTDCKIAIPELSGIFTAPDLRKNSSMKIWVTSFSAVSGSSGAAGKLAINNFDKPFAKFTGEIRLSTDDFPIRFSDSAEIRAGQVIFNGEYAGPLKSMDGWEARDAASIQLHGNGEFRFDRFTGLHSLQNISRGAGRFLLGRDTVIIEEFSFMFAGSDVYFKGRLSNFSECILIKNKTIPVTGSLRTDFLDLNSLSGKNGNDTVWEFGFPSRLAMNMHFDIGKVIFRRFEADHLNGRLAAAGAKLIINPVSFKTMEGTASGKFLMEAASEGGYIISCDAALEKINIQKLFYSMENFGQEYITDRQLKGAVAAKVEFASVWDERMNVLPEKVFSAADITIARGELNDFKPLEQLSDYIALSELKKVKFSTLQNRIEIRDRKIFIPEMEVRSSALNLIVSGLHTFDNEIDYKIKVKMGEVTAKKAKKAKKENEEFGIMEEGDGGMTLFLSMSGTVNNPVMKYDKKAAFVKMKDDLKEEKQELKTILHEEFGLFKKDSALKKPVSKEKPKDPFVYEWE